MEDMNGWVGDRVREDLTSVFGVLAENRNLQDFLTGSRL